MTLRSRNATAPQTITEGCTQPGAVSIKVSGTRSVNSEYLRWWTSISRSLFEEQGLREPVNEMFGETLGATRHRRRSLER